MKDLYKSRKGTGSLSMEMDALKSDNEQLIALLKKTTEYADLDDEAIKRKALTGSHALGDNFEMNKRARGVTPDAIKNQAIVKDRQ